LRDSQAFCVRGLVSLTQRNLSFLTTIIFVSRIADEPLVKNFVLLFINTFWGEDACVLRCIFTSIRKTQNQAEAAIKLARSQPTQAGAEGALAPARATGAREMWEPDRAVP
jgi:hypothetical protein